MTARPQSRPKGEPPRSVWVVSRRGDVVSMHFNAKVAGWSCGSGDTVSRYDLHRPKSRREAKPHRRKARRQAGRRKEQA